METNYKRTVAGSLGAGMASVFNASGRQYYILEHKTESLYHHAGESQKIIVDQIELGRDSSCQVRFDESFETVSRRHAAIVKEGDGWKLINLSQTNPTFVNGSPIDGEWKLNSGDEIRLSSKGPLMGFIIPQGKQSLVSSIGLTERMNLFRKQALRPYKRAIWILAIVLILAVAGLIAWNLYQQKKFDTEIKEKQVQIDSVNKQIEESDATIVNLQDELKSTKENDKAEKARIQAALKAAQKDREKLSKDKDDLIDAVNDLVDHANATEDQLNSAQQYIQEQKAKAAREKKAAEEAAKEVTIEDIVNAERRSDPTLQ